MFRGDCLVFTCANVKKTPCNISFEDNGEVKESQVVSFNDIRQKEMHLQNNPKQNILLSDSVGHIGNRI